MTTLTSTPNRFAWQVTSRVASVLEAAGAIDPMSVAIILEYGDGFDNRYYTAKIHVGTPMEVEAFREALGEPPKAMTEEPWNGNADQLVVASADGVIRAFTILPKAGA